MAALKTTCSQLEVNIKAQLQAKEMEIDDLVTAQKHIIANYDKQTEEATGLLKTQLAKEKEENLKALRAQLL
jgi:hypothetical protein